MRCSNCGTENPQDYRFCGNCGNTLTVYQPPEHPSYSAAHAPSLSPLNKRLLIGALLVAVAAIFCIGCLAVGALFLLPNNTAASAPKTTPGPSSTEASIVASSISDPTPTLTINSIPTSTSNSASASAAATHTPVPGKKWKASQVVDAFKAVGLEIANPRPMTKEDYGSVPQVAQEGIRFFLPSLGGNKGGRIYSFASNSDLQTVKQYYDAQSGTPPWIFIKDNILVQIHGDLPKARAQQYQGALNAMK